MIKDAYYAQDSNGDVFIRISVEDNKKVTEFLANDDLFSIDREWSYKYLPLDGVYELIKEEEKEDYTNEKTTIKKEAIRIIVKEEPEIKRAMINAILRQYEEFKEKPFSKLIKTDELRAGLEKILLN